MIVASLIHLLSLAGLIGGVIAGRGSITGVAWLGVFLTYAISGVVLAVVAL